MLNAQDLEKWVDQPETHRKIVGDYAGSYSLGIKGNAFSLRVEPKEVSAFPDRVTIDGVEVPVIVEGNFKPPVPLNSGH
jgi:hypothetical protein